MLRGASKLRGIRERYSLRDHESGCSTDQWRRRNSVDSIRSCPSKVQPRVDRQIPSIGGMVSGTGVDEENVRNED